MRLNIHHTVLYYSTGKLAPEKVIRASEKRREQGAFTLWFGKVKYCVVNI